MMIESVSVPETRLMILKVFASYECQPCLGGLTWTTVFHCPVEGCFKTAKVDCVSRRKMWRLCSRCARKFNRKPGHIRFVPKQTLPRIQQELIRKNMGTQVNGELNRVFKTSWSYVGGKDAPTDP